MAAGADIPVDGEARQQRIQNLENGLRQQEGDREEDQNAVGPHVAQQPAHQAAVICFAENLFFHVFSG
jgi:hypothetical protein